MKRLAWRTTFNGITSICASMVATTAKGMTLRSAKNAGYEGSYWDIECKRAPEFDAWAPNAPHHPVAEEWVRRELATSGEGTRT